MNPSTLLAYAQGANICRLMELSRLNMFERKIHIIFPDETKVIGIPFIKGLLDPIFRKSGYATVFNKIEMTSAGNIHNRAFMSVLQEYRNAESGPKKKPWDTLYPGIKIR
jgi:hypothetical protein